MALALIAVALAVGVQYYGGAAGARLQGNDDFVAYLVFPEKILGTGTLIEPFSLRRMSAYGGQSLLQAVTLIGGANALQAPLLDMGICVVGVVALVLGARPRGTPVALWGAPVLLLLTLPNMRFNSASEMSGVLFFLALYRTVVWSSVEAKPARRALVLGMLAAAAASLRHSYLVPAFLFVAIAFAPGIVGAYRRRTESRRPLVEAAVAITSMLVLLLPWALLSYRSNGTLLFPLSAGNYRAEYGLTAAEPVVAHLRAVWMNLRHCHPVRWTPVFLLLGMLLGWRSTAGGLPALAWASMLGLAAIAYGFQTNEWDLSRYYFGFVVATTLAVMVHVLAFPWNVRWVKHGRAHIPAVVVLVAIVFQLAGTWREVHANYRELLRDIRAAAGEPSSLSDRDDPYRRVQASTPVGAPILAMLDEPFWLDYRRNPISVLDLPGAASPPPGLPLADDEEFARYLTLRGFRYLAFVRPAASHWLYRREPWKAVLARSTPTIARRSAPVHLDVFDRLEGLLSSRARLYDDRRMVVIDVSARPHR